MNKDSQSSVDSLEHALRLGGRLVENIASRQWDAHTPCSEWTVRDLLAHVVGMNLVFAAMLAGKQLLLDAFGVPGVLEQSFQSPIGTATGLERLQIRSYDLLAHLWDLAQATGQQLENDPVLQASAQQALEFAGGQLAGVDRAGRFAPPAAN